MSGHFRVLHAAGEIDAWGGRFEGLLLVPLIAVAVYVFMLVVPRWDKNLANGPNRYGLYPGFRLAIMPVLACAQILVTVSGLHLERVRPPSFRRCLASFSCGWATGWASLATIVVFVFWYSYHLYRIDPEPQPPFPDAEPT